jgi:DNA polymerase III alpha subunit (gram-positive type)
MAIEIDVTIFCSECRSVLDFTEETRNKYGVELVVEPCSNCQEKAKEEGREGGYRDGILTGREAQNEL